MQYHAHIGEGAFDSNGGYAERLAETGLAFQHPPGGITFGGDLRWRTPWHSLLVGSSALSQAIDGTGPGESVHVPPGITKALYVQWDHGKLSPAAEYWRFPINPVLTIGPEIVHLPLDERSWYVMASYRVSKNLQLGSYYSHYQNKAADQRCPQTTPKTWWFRDVITSIPMFTGTWKIIF